MQRQQAISQKRLKRKVGSRERVIIDEVGPGSRTAKGRSKGDAPQIDGTVTSHVARAAGRCASARSRR
jgi:ribosomal protein S12 methylthiotransferase